MNKKRKRLYLVKREVYAKSLKEALTAPGEVYEVAMAEDKFQPEEKVPEVGFTNKRVVQ